MTKQSDSENNVPDTKKIIIQAASKIVIELKGDKSLVHVIPVSFVSLFAASSLVAISVISRNIVFTNKQPFNCFGWLIFFPEDIQALLVDKWNRWERERGQVYAFLKMCLYLRNLVKIPIFSISLPRFKRKSSSTQVSLQRKG